MAGDARPFRHGLKTLVILGAVAGIVGCAKKSDPGSASGGVSGDDFAALKAAVDSLKDYRARNAAYVDQLGRSYYHFYYCDNPTHKDATVCGPPMQNHIAPPGNPPPKL